MDEFNVYLTGVGGQGIGLLSEILIRAADRAGFHVISVDTHGLAQRGGVVVSQLRMGDSVFSPLIPAGCADLVVALERHEALRGMQVALKNRGALVYYDAVWQPLDVRLKKASEVGKETIAELCRSRGIREIRVDWPNLPDARMQNVVILGALDAYRLIPGIDTDSYEGAMQDLMTGKMLEGNLSIFRDVSARLKDKQT